MGIANYTAAKYNTAQFTAITETIEDIDDFQNRLVDNPDYPNDIKLIMLNTITKILDIFKVAMDAEKGKRKNSGEFSYLFFNITDKLQEEGHNTDDEWQLKVINAVVSMMAFKAIEYSI